MKNNKSNKKYGMKIVSCLVASAALFGVNTSMVKALDYDNSTDLIAVKENTSDILIDSDLKEFNNLDKIYKFLGFNCKVPDYVANGFKPLKIKTFNLLNNNKILDLCYSDSYYAYQYYVEAFKGQPGEILKEFNADKPELTDNIESSETEKNINGIKGDDITITKINKDLVTNLTEKQVNKYFVWQDDNIYYSIKYADLDSTVLSDDEIGKIAQSLKEKDKLTNVNYVVQDDTDLNYISVYDKEDLEKCKTILGYNPKFPLKINDDITLSNCDLDIDGTTTKHTTFNGYYAFDGGVMVYIQEKDADSYGYEDIKKNGYAFKNGSDEKVNVDKLNISNIDVYKYVDDSDKKLVYQWKDNSVYYFFEVYYNEQIGNADNIVNKFVNADTID